ncbi:50S ribosomal protein L18 [bacterium]|nr:50S ribosomal protein L18 [bacterium]
MSTIARKKLERRARIKKSIRSKISGTAQRPRLSVFRSNKEIYVQLIDDVNSNTLMASSSMDSAAKEGAKTKIEVAANVGKLIAAKAKEANIATVVFDRNGYLYHGRVKALADAARENGLNF